MIQDEASWNIIVHLEIWSAVLGTGVAIGCGENLGLNSSAEHIACLRAPLH